MPWRATADGEDVVADRFCPCSSPAGAYVITCAPDAAGASPAVPYLRDVPDGHVVGLQSWCRLVHPAAPRQGQCYQQPQKHRDDDLLHDTPPICESLRVWGTATVLADSCAALAGSLRDGEACDTPEMAGRSGGSAQAADDDSVETVIGAPGRIRTCDLKIRSLLLYPAELRALDVATSRRDETRSGALGRHSEWSGRRASNPRPSAWKADALAN